jgi:hypothetical protein
MIGSLTEDDVVDDVVPVLCPVLCEEVFNPAYTSVVNLTTAFCPS